MKRRLLLIISTAIMLVLALYSYNLFKPRPELKGTALQNPVYVGDVSLSNKLLGKVPLSYFKGKTSLIFFGFSECYDVCPLTLKRLAKIYKDIGEPKDLQIIMITVDPATDTVEAVQNYASSFHESFLGFSGTNSEIADAAKAFFVGYQDLGNTQFNHTDAVYVVDKESKIQRIYGQPDLRYLENDLKAILSTNTY